MLLEHMQRQTSNNHLGSYHCQDWQKLMREVRDYYKQLELDKTSRAVK
jgi:hypothetical protein